MKKPLPDMTKDDQIANLTEAVLALQRDIANANQILDLTTQHYREMTENRDFWHRKCLGLERKAQRAAKKPRTKTKRKTKQRKTHSKT